MVAWYENNAFVTYVVIHVLLGCLAFNVTISHTHVAAFLLVSRVSFWDYWHDEREERTSS